MRTIFIILGAIVVLILIVGGAFWYMSKQPLYQPGMVSTGDNLSGPLEPPAQTLGTNLWKVETDVELSYFSEGSGQNVLVIHGGPGMPFTEPAKGLSLLSSDNQFYYYAQRGCGDSSRLINQFDSKNTYQNMRTLDQTLGIGAQIADIERIRRILDEERIILFGHSWGGLLASLYAVEFPENVEALVLVSPANMLVMPQVEAESDLFSSVRAKLPDDKKAEFDAFMKEYFDFGSIFEKTDDELVTLNAKFGEYYLSIYSSIESDETVAFPPQGRPGGWMVWAQYLSLGQRYDLRPYLNEVDVPVLVIHGADDLQSESASRLYAEAFQNAEFVVIDDAAHNAFEEQPEEFAQIVSEFLSK
jgi:proline iminopeptidase